MFLRPSHVMTASTSQGALKIGKLQDLSCSLLAGGCILLDYDALGKSPQTSRTAHRPFCCCLARGSSAS
eukprot:746806-Hanusia_phi.AAC.4